jgi:hypothetical protein
MAGTTDDHEERRRFLEDAGVYAELVKQIGVARTRTRNHSKELPPEERATGDRA